MVDEYLREPSHPGQNSGFFCPKGGGGVVGHCKFGVSESFVLAAVPLGQVMMFHEANAVFSVLQLFISI